MTAVVSTGVLLILAVQLVLLVKTIKIYLKMRRDR